jgi:hypothetical protein
MSWVVDDYTGASLAYTLMTIFPENEKLGNRMSEAGFGFIQRSHQYQACQLTLYSHDKWVSPWFRPVVVKAIVSKQPVCIYIAMVKLAEVVGIQLHQVAQNSFVFQRGSLYFDVHAETPRLPRPFACTSR